MSRQKLFPPVGERRRIAQLAKKLQRAVLDHWLVDGAPLQENLGRVTWPTNCSLTEAGERFAVQAEKVGIPLRELKTAIADISPGSLSEDASDELKAIIQDFKARPSEGENTLWSLLCRGEQPEERGAKPAVGWSYEQRRALADLHSLVKTIPESIGRAPFHAVRWEDVQRLEAAAKVLCEAEEGAGGDSTETAPPIDDTGEEGSPEEPAKPAERKKLVNFGNWAIGCEGTKWYLFQWLPNKKKLRDRGLVDVPKGHSEKLALAFCEHGGEITKSQAISLFRVGDRNYWPEKRVFDSTCKVARKHLANAIRGAIARTVGCRAIDGDPIPWDRDSASWKCEVNIGLATKNDQGRIEFQPAVTEVTE